MARIRTIKPEFFTSEDIVALSPLARLLYIALWIEADREGRLVWKPATFKLRYLPGDDCDATRLCSEVVSRGLVILYGSGYAVIPSFKAHQHINNRESESQLPEPDAKSTRAPRVGTRRSREPDAQGGREGKGREGENDSSPEQSPFAPGFEKFWATWPKSIRKGAKVKCLDAWKNGRLEGSSDEIIAHVEQLKTSSGWQDKAGQFVPAPLTYLNQRRWDGAEGVACSSSNEFGGCV